MIQLRLVILPMLKVRIQLGRWKHDEFGRFVKRYMVEDKAEITPPAGEDAPIEPLHDPQVTE